MAHITGGGLLDNLPRVLPDHLSALVDLPTSGWVLPPVFKWLQTLANLPQVRGRGSVLVWLLLEYETWNSKHVVYL